MQIGVDLVSISTVPRGVSSAAAYLNMFTDFFTTEEMSIIKTCALLCNHKHKIMKLNIKYEINLSSGETDKDVLRRFYINWALKESVVKAIGCGIGTFQLNKVQ